MLKTAALLLTGGATISFLFVYGGTSRELTEFITIPVEHGVLKETVVATGQVESLTVVEVGSQVSGRIAKVHVTYNDNVTEGQALAQIDRQSFAARVREAEADIEISLAAVEVQRAIVDKTLVEIEVAELEQQVFLAKVDEAQAILTIALAKLNRKKQLQRNGTVAFAEVEDDEGAVLTARARLREAEAVLASNKLRISATRADLVRAKAELN
ncbi:MAG: biotin/lipoyl-binding protein, partial [Hyphomicrobiales bacterium]